MNKTKIIVVEDNIVYCEYMTDYAEVNTAVESMKLGSIDYIPKQLVEDKLVPSMLQTK